MPQTLHNQKRLENIRRTLRKRQTKPEILVWSKIRNKKIGYKFKRQHSIGPFIVDFYCPKLHLIIELDGPLHFEEIAQKKDKIREQFLIKHNLKIIRFHTEKVMNNLETVITIIKSYCDEVSTSPFPSSSEEGDYKNKIPPNN